MLDCSRGCPAPNNYPPQCTGPYFLPAFWAGNCSGNCWLLKRKDSLFFLITNNYPNNYPPRMLVKNRVRCTGAGNCCGRVGLCALVLNLVRFGAGGRGSLRRHAVPRDAQFCFSAPVCCFELETWLLPDVGNYDQRNFAPKNRLHSVMFVCFC
jgi:hypothetical protein